VFSIGVGLLLPNLSDKATSSIEPECRHLAIGVITMGLVLGQLVSSLADEPALDAEGLRPAFGVAATLLGVGALVLPNGLAFLLPRDGKLREASATRWLNFAI